MNDISNIYYTEGSVGIGTSVPHTDYTLDVSGPVKVNDNLSIGITHDLDVSSTLDVSGLSLFTGPIRIGTRNINEPFLMDVSGDVLIRGDLYSQGNVGIGKNQLDPNYNLDVSGNINCNNFYIDGVDISNSICLLYTSPSPRDLSTSRMPSSA